MRVLSDVKLSHLTGLIAKIKPAVDAIPSDGSDRASRNYAFVERVAELNVKMTVENILRSTLPGAKRGVCQGRNWGARRLASGLQAKQGGAFLAGKSRFFHLQSTSADRPRVRRSRLSA